MHRELAVVLSVVTQLGTDAPRTQLRKALRLKGADTVSVHFCVAADSLTNEAALSAFLASVISMLAASLSFVIDALRLC